MTINDQVGSITRTRVIPTVFDQVSIKSAFLINTLAKAADWTSGKSIEVPVKVAKSTTGGGFGIGTRLDSDRQTNRKLMNFAISGNYKPVVIDDIEAFLNQGAEQVLNAVTTEVDSMAADLMDDMADQLYVGTGSGLDWQSIDVVADDGTNYGTYGTLSRTTHDSLDGYYLASAGALTLGKLATAWDGTERGDAGPTETYTTKTLWSAYEDLNTPTVSANYSATGGSVMAADGTVGSRVGMRGQQGFEFLTFRGTPIFKDEACPSGRMYLVNSDTNGKFANFGAVMADLSSLGAKYRTVNFKNTDGKAKGTFGSRTAPKGFNFRDMMSPTDQLAEVGYLIMAGNFIGGQPNLQGQMRGLTA